MRTTLDVDDDVLAAAKDLAAGTKSTTGKVLSDLARRSLTEPVQGPLLQKNGFWILPTRGGVVTPELVKRLAEDNT